MQKCSSRRNPATLAHCVYNNTGAPYSSYDFYDFYNLTILQFYHL